MNVMRLKTLFIAIPFCAATLTSAAQKGIVGRIDSLLEVRQKRSAARYDTAYIAKPEQRWTVKLGVNASGSDLYARGNLGGDGFRSDLEAQMKATLSANISYRALSLGLSLNPAKLAGRNNDYELNLNAYGNRMGADLLVTSARTFGGTAERGGESADIAPGQVRMRTIQGNIYYSLNHRRFSFPAAFTQSQVQKRSCGLWLVGLSALGGRVEYDENAMHGYGPVSLSVINVGLGAGYAHNFVLGRKWLLHISALPQVVVYSHAKLTVGGERLRSPFRFPSIISVGRIAAVHYFKNRFIGISSVVNVWSHGDKDRLLVENVKWRARLFYGFRF